MFSVSWVLTDSVIDSPDWGLVPTSQSLEYPHGCATLLNVTCPRLCAFTGSWNWISYLSVDRHSRHTYRLGFPRFLRCCRAHREADRNKIRPPLSVPPSAAFVAMATCTCYGLEQRAIVFLSNLRKVRHRCRRIRSKRKPILWRRRKRWFRCRRGCCHGDGSGHDFDEISPESGAVTERSLGAYAFPLNAKRVDRGAYEP